MIVFGSYDNCKLRGNGVVSVSRDGGEKVDFEGYCYPALAPSKKLMNEWEFYRGRISEDSLERIFVEKYYHEVLSELDPEKIYKLFDNKVVLDYGDSPVRHVVSAWLNIFLGGRKYENSDEVFESEVIDQSSRFNDCLEEVVKEKFEMMGYQSLQATYAAKQALKYRSLALRDVSERKAHLYEEKADLLETKALELEELCHQSIITNYVVSEVWFEEQGNRLCISKKLKYNSTEIDGQLKFF